ncbi:voltage-gated potassium channel [Aureococcus anophagefferens]|nr:voltage-gated potassium channel [Aureococcus anophagefferens]
MGRRSFFGGRPAAPLKLPEKQHIHRESMREAVEEAKTEMDPTIEGKRKRWSHIKMLVKNTDKLYEIMLEKEEKKVVSKKVPSFIWERSGRDVVPVEEDGALEDDAAPPPSPAPGSLSPSPSERTVGNRVVALAYVSLMVPMRLGFDWSAVGVWYAVETALDLYYFFLDIFVNFLTALYRRDEGHIEGLEEHLSPGLIIDKRRIARAYLRGWFLVDALACAPVDYFMRGVNGTLLCSAHPVHPCLRQSSASSKASAFRLFKILRVFRVLKLFRLFRLKRLFKKYQDELLYWMPLIQASKLFFMLIFASHWMGCAYATVFPFDERLSQGLGERYVDMVYWAMQTITTVGYGDMVSTKTSARLVSTTAMAVGGLIFGWLIQYVLNVLDPDTFERKQQARIERVMGYLRANALPVELSQRVIRHVRQQNSRQTEDRAVLMELPRQLRADVFEHLYKASLSDVTIFAGASGEVVYGENDLADEGTFIVNSGEIELTVLSVMPEHRNHHKKHHHRLPRVAVPTARLTNGAIFGEESCLGCSRRHDTATACKTSELLTIAGADFRLALDLLPKLRWRILKRHIEQRMRHTRNRHTTAKAFLEMDLPELVVGKVQDEVLGVNELTGKTATVDRDISIADDWREVLIGLRGPWEARHTRQHRMAPTDLSKTTSFTRSNDHLEGVASTQHAGRDDADNGLAPPSRGVDAPGTLGAGGVDVDWIRAEIRQSLRDEFQVELGVYKEAVANEVKFAVAREFERELAAYKAQIAAEVRDAVGREFQREHELFKQEFAAEVAGAVTAALDARSGKLAPLNS